MQENIENKRNTGDFNPYVKVDEIAKCIGKSVRRVQQLTQEGILHTSDVKNGKRTTKRYDKYKTIQAYIEYIQKMEQKRNGGNKEQEKIQVEIDIKKTKLKMENLKLEELEGKMHAAEDVESLVTDLALNVRSNLLAIPGQLAASLAELDSPTEISEVLQDKVRDVLGDLANYKYDPKEYQKRARERQGWLNDEQGESEDE